MNASIKFFLPFLYIFFLSLINLNCKKGDCYPDCISDQIKEVEKTDLPGANISEYLFQGHNVYYVFKGYSPDAQYAVINTNCELLGYLEGFIGNTIINGEDFIKNAKLIKVVWKSHKWQ